jgi:hypothetical protein
MIVLKANQVRTRPGVGTLVVLMINGKWCEVQWLAGGRAGLPPLDQNPNRPLGWDVGRLAAFSGDDWIVVNAAEG